MTTVKQFLHVGRYPRMWWERTIGPADLSRADLRLSGWDTYAIVASVLLQVILGLYGSISVPDEKAARKEKLVFEAQMGMLTVAVLCSTFTMVIFLLNKIYCATALGMWKDVSYEVFREKSLDMRVKAFWSLNIALGCFMTAFIMNLLHNLKREGKRRLVIIGTITTIGLVLMVGEVSSMMKLASKLVFD